jgi:hypothetical protein
MKITKKYLRQVIQEELSAIISEEDNIDPEVAADALRALEGGEDEVEAAAELDFDAMQKELGGITTTSGLAQWIRGGILDDVAANELDTIALFIYAVAHFAKVANLDKANSTPAVRRALQFVKQGYDSQVAKK